MTKKILYIFIFLFASNLIFSQNNTGNEISLAYEYYRSKDYDKAEVLFKKIFEKTHAKIYFTYYANCLIVQSKYDIAEKEIKNQVRKNKKDLSYYVDLGYLYKKRNNSEDAKKYFKKALKKLRSNPSQVRAVASAFIQRQEYENAEEAYYIGRQTTRGTFRSELANLYAIQRKYDKMIDQYLFMLEQNSRNITLVQNRLQYFLKKDINDEFANTLQTELIKRIQKPHSGIVFNQMLIWHYMQRKEFGKALFQQMAIDKRLHSSSKKVIELAEIAKENNDLITASTAYEYVIDKGENMPYFVDAKLGHLNVNYLKVQKGTLKNNEDLLKLEKEYELALIRFGINTKTIKAIVDLSHLQAFYLNKPKAAEDLLTNAIEIRGLDKKIAAKCKIKLGDILVFQNDLDYAALIYGQAEMDNKGNSLGDISKLKKAKLAYFANNFQWAKAQFDALKASTSKPVANDALYYSIHISENTEDDSLQLALKTFARAELFVFRHKTDSAIILLDTLISKNDGHQIIDDAIFLKAKIYEQDNDFIYAEKFYKKVITEYSWDILSDVATYRLAIMYEEKLNNKEEAAEYYKKLMLEHPDSIYVSDARRRFRKIRDGV